MSIEITADNFADYFTLDYPSSLVDGLSGIVEKSSVVRTLSAWCERQGTVVSESVCREVLDSLIEVCSP